MLRNPKVFQGLCNPLIHKLSLNLVSGPHKSLFRDEQRGRQWCPPSLGSL
jgi:hypothetical protein